MHLYKGADKEGIFIEAKINLKDNILSFSHIQSKQPFPFKSFRSTIYRRKLYKHHYKGADKEGIFKGADKKCIFMKAQIRKASL